MTPHSEFEEARQVVEKFKLRTQGNWAIRSTPRFLASRAGSAGGYQQVINKFLWVVVNFSCVRKSSERNQQFFNVVSARRETPPGKKLASVKIFFPSSRLGCADANDSSRTCDAAGDRSSDGLDRTLIFAAQARGAVPRFVAALKRRIFRRTYA